MVKHVYECLCVQATYFLLNRIIISPANNDVTASIFCLDSNHVDRHSCMFSERRTFNRRFVQMHKTL